MPERPRVLIVAVSGRSLAASARRAGYAPLVADLFCDDDTRALAQGCVRIGASPSPRSRGEGAPRSGADEGQHEPARLARLPRERMPEVGAAPHPALRATFSPQTGRRGARDDWRVLDSSAVLDSLETLAGDAPVAGVVYGTGLEDNPALIDAIADRWPLWGNDGATVARLKEPTGFSDMCRDGGVAHPEIVRAPSPATREKERAPGWLAKQCGGSGGSHIRPAEDVAVASERIYFQRRVDGRPVSALFLADGAHARIVGFSEQWTAPTATAPFRYAGAVQPADLTEPMVAQTLTLTIERLVAASRVVGLCSADFLLDGERAWCLEINPRPGATLDIFDSDDTPLFAFHVRACGGELPAAVRGGRDARAAQIVYAERRIAAVPEIDWPQWAADRQPAGSFVAQGEPLCTVLSSAPTKGEALRRLRLRADAMIVAASGRAA